MGRVVHGWFMGKHRPKKEKREESLAIARARRLDAKIQRLEASHAVRDLQARRPLFQWRAADAVDRHVVNAWVDELMLRDRDGSGTLTRGRYWLACSELLAAYGYGRPTQHTAVEAGQSLYDLLAAVDARQAALGGTAPVVVEAQLEEQGSMTCEPEASRELVASRSEDHE